MLKQRIKNSSSHFLATKPVMAVKRSLRPSRLLRMLCLLLSLLAGIYFLGSSTPSYNNRWTEDTKHLTGKNNIEEVAFLTSQRTGARGKGQLAQHSETGKRRNLIIVSHGRSGSSLMGDIFNHHPSVFYMYEPLQTAERVQWKSNQGRNYASTVELFLTSLFRCAFDNPEILADIERYYRKPDHPRISQAIASPPLCPYELTDSRWDPKLCYPMTSESLRSACKINYNLTVIKVLLSRIPENNIKHILNPCNSFDVDCKIVFLVRDPRAVIPSSRSIGFFKEKADNKALLSTRFYSYKQCKQTEDNLEFIRKLPDFLRSKIKLQRYEDLTINPLKELSALYEFAGLPVMQKVRAWLNETTQQSRAACRLEDGAAVTCTKDDAWAATNRWRWKVHPHEIDVIERYCQRVLLLMGYRPVDGSHDLLADKEIPLFSSDYEAKHWFLN